MEMQTTTGIYVRLGCISDVYMRGDQVNVTELCAQTTLLLLEV